MNKSKRRKKTMRKLKHKKRTIRGGSMNTNQITKKANALRSTASSMIPSTKKIRNQANALRSTAIEKLNPFYRCHNKIKWRYQNETEKIYRKYGYSTRHFTLGRK